MPKADVIIIMDFDRSIALYRVIKRVIMVRLKMLKLADAPNGCLQKIDKSFLSYIWNFHQERRPLIDKALKKYAYSAAVHILRTPAEVQKFLKSVAEQ